MSTADAPTAEPVRLEYTLAADDLLDGLTAAHRVVQRPWYLRHLNLLIVAGVVLFFVAKTALSGDTSATSWIALAVASVVVLLLTVLMTWLFRRVADPAKLTYRWSSRQLIRGNPMLAQPLRVVVGADGVQVASAAGETTARWTQHPYHVETAKSVALLASDRIGAAVLVLPKRAMGKGDLTVLRALLAAHTRRLG
ncbi:hypothetical protein ACL02O_22880 [Micromonospora sp. MS34]|uniref:hypothetical protein n=1 Tax=Micromonospora sp. MS34 TaxID=3385971 RepID=UPI0039A33E57